jgi:hypothetical protein
MLCTQSAGNSFVLLLTDPTREYISDCSSSCAGEIRRGDDQEIAWRQVRTVMQQPASSSGRTVAGPETIAGTILTTEALQRARITPDAARPVVNALGDLLPGNPVQAGSAAVDRLLPANALASLIPSAAIVAAGLDPAKTALPAPAVLWTSGASRLLVNAGKVTATLGDGTIDIVVPVSSDQTGDAAVTVTFVTGTSKQPAGGLVTTEDHPRGPAIIVENWAEPLVAFAWHTLLVATNALSGAAGGDMSDNNLITAAIAVDRTGLSVTPMGRHTFFAGGRIP